MKIWPRLWPLQSGDGSAFPHALLCSALPLTLNRFASTENKRRRGLINTPTRLFAFYHPKRVLRCSRHRPSPGSLRPSRTNPSHILQLWLLLAPSSHPNPNIEIHWPSLHSIGYPSVPPPRHLHQRNANESKNTNRITFHSPLW